MSERWWRAWEDFSCDPKFFGVSARSGQTLERVVFVWVRILGSAAKLRAGGAYRLDPVETAAILRCKPINITMILAAMEKAKLVADGVVANWAKRQFEERQQDGAEEPAAVVTAGAKRTRRWRDKRRHTGVTPASPTVTETVTPSTKSESEAKTETNNTATARAEPVDRAPKQATLLLPIDGGGQPPRPKPDHDRLDAALRTAAGESLNAVSTGLIILSDPLRWLENGCDLELDVLPALRAVAARPSTKPGAVRSWNFFSGAVFEARDRRTTGPPTGSPVIDIGNQRTGDRDEQRRQPASQAERAVSAMAAVYARRMGNDRQREG